MSFPLKRENVGRGGRQDGGYGGGGYGQGLIAQQGGYMDQPSQGVSGGTPAQGCVVMVYGLDPDKMNCDRVFNLFCLYGNVIRVCGGFYIGHTLSEKGLNVCAESQPMSAGTVHAG